MSLDRADATPICWGYRWTIQDSDALASLLARLILGEHLHARKVIEGNTSVGRAPTASDIDKAVAKLQLRPEQDPWHRDGWVMQMISWVATYKRSGAACTVRAPQPRKADKGFDGIFIDVDTQGKLVVTVCEDKATDNARKMFAGKVIPALKELEEGHRDAELVNEVTTILQTMPNIDAAAAIAALDWDTSRRYRVAVTVTAEDNSEAGRTALFKGYDAVATGAIERRCGETLLVEPLREWMNTFCGTIVSKLNLLRPAPDVRPANR